MLVILNVVYVLLAIAMIALILMQRGAGAQAGSGFGAGASGTVFGATGASNFLSKATKWLAIVFMVLALFMAWHATRSAAPVPVAQDLGVMGELPEVPGVPASELPAAPVPASPAQEVPSVPDAEVPAVPPASRQAPAPADGEG
jgi:preprotein translocase subunit SecG